MRLRTLPGTGSADRDDQSAGSVPRKGVLVCPECGHESRPDGDWLRAESADRTSYACPTCGTVVVTQPSFPRPDAR